MLSCELGPMTEGADEVEVLGSEVISRLRADLHAALKRRPAQEARLAGILRVLSRYSPSLRAELVLGRRDDGAACVVRAAALRRPGASARRATGPSAGPGALAGPPDRARAAWRASRRRRSRTTQLCARCSRGLAVSRHSRDRVRGGARARRPARIARSARCLDRAQDQGGAPHHALPRDARPAASAATTRSERLRGVQECCAIPSDTSGAGWCSPSSRPEPAIEGRSAKPEERASEGPSSARSAWALVAWALDQSRPEMPVRPDARADRLA